MNREGMTQPIFTQPDPKPTAQREAEIRLAAAETVEALRRFKSKCEVLQALTDTPPAGGTLSARLAGVDDDGENPFLRAAGRRFAHDPESFKRWLDKQIENQFAIGRALSKLDDKEIELLGIRCLVEIPPASPPPAPPAAERPATFWNRLFPLVSYHREHSNTNRRA